jgi:hypothetical protein
VQQSAADVCSGRCTGTALALCCSAGCDPAS